MNLFNKAIKYADIIILFTIGFVLFKVIDNIHMFLPIIGKAYSIVSTFVYALIIAYILNPLMKFFEKRCKCNRGISIMFTYAILLGVVFLIAFFGVPSLVNSLIELTKSIPSFIVQVQDWFNDLLKNDSIKSLLMDTGIMHRINIIPENVGKVVMNIANSSVTAMLSTTGYLIKWVFGFIISIYVLYDKEKFTHFSRTITFMIFKEKNGKMLIELVRNLHKMIGLYVGTKAIDSLIIGLLSFIGMMIIGVPYAFLLSIVVGFTNMIPYFGPFVGMLVSSLITVFTSPIKSLIVLVFLFLLQQFDAWFLDPTLIGNKVGLSPFLIILAVTIGGGVYGPVGMILAVPITAMIKIYVDKKLANFRGTHNELDKI